MTQPPPFRVGLIGAGGIWSAHKPAFQRYPDRVRVAAVTDLCHENAQKVSAEFPGATVYPDAATLLRDAAIDGVLILTVHDQHHALALQAAEAGRHVLVEKPMACSLAEAEEMVAAADKAGVTLMVGQCQRYSRSYAGVRRLIAEGEIGEIHAVRFDSMQGLFHNKILPAGHWLCDGKRAGGGIVISVCVHRIDLIRYCVGEIARVAALTQTRTGDFVNGAEDFAAALLEFGSGAIGEMFGTYSGYRMPYSEGLMIFGDKGTIHAQPNNGEYHAPAVYASETRCGPAGDSPWLGQFRGFLPVPEEGGEDFPDENPFVNQMLHFADCCRTGREPLSSGRDNLGTMRVIDGIYRSAASGKWEVLS